MKYLKKYENNDEIAYKLNDIVVCSTKQDKFNDYQGYINQNGGFIGGEYITYGRKYKIVDIYYSGYRYDSVPKWFGYGNYKVDIENLKTGKIMQNFDSDLFTLESKWNPPDEPMIGDYVICEFTFPEEWEREDFNEFIKKNVGRCVSANDSYKSFTIRYRNVPRDLRHSFWNTTNPYIKDLGNINVERKNIIFYSNNIEDAEDYIKLNQNINKYNL